MKIMIEFSGDNTVSEIAAAAKMLGKWAEALNIEESSDAAVVLDPPNISDEALRAAVVGDIDAVKVITTQSSAETTPAESVSARRDWPFKDESAASDVNHLAIAAGIPAPPTQPDLPGMASAAAITLPPPVEGPPEEELDAAGEKWDEAIHSANRAKTKEGKWRRRRNTGMTAAHAAAYAATTTLPPPAEAPAAPFVASAEPSAAPVSTSAEMASAGVATNASLFETILDRAIKAEIAGWIKPQELLARAREAGLSSLMELRANEQVLRFVAAGLGLLNDTDRNGQPW